MGLKFHTFRLQMSWTSSEMLKLYWVILESGLYIITAFAKRFIGEYTDRPRSPECPDPTT